jgi:FO synthase
MNAAREGATGLSIEDLYRLARTQGSDLAALMQVASRIRDAAYGSTVTYSRKVFIPLTNLCRDKCGYCTFAKAPRHPEARTLTPDEVLGIAEDGARHGCKEALFSLGEKPEDRYAVARSTLARFGYRSTVSYLSAMCDLVYRETGLIPHANCGVLAREEIEELREVNGSMGLMLESSSERLLRRGQAHFGCVGKVPTERLRTMEMAADLGVAFTTGILIGIGETPEERVDSLLAIRDLNQRTGNVQEVIIQNFRAKPDIRMRSWPEPSALDMVRTIAVARLIFGGDMSIQAPPNLSPDSHAFYLLAGINDWGGVSPVTKDHINPERAWPAIAELRRATEDAGFELRERLCLYPSFLRQPRFLRARFAARVQDLTDSAGLVRREATIA